jgi:hypothetical protein
MSTLPRRADLPAYPALLLLAILHTIYSHSSHVTTTFTEDDSSSSSPAISSVTPLASPISSEESESENSDPGSPVTTGIPRLKQFPRLRAEAPIFRPRSESGSATANIWTNIPNRARELRELAETEYQAGSEYKRRADEYNAEASKLIFEGMLSRSLDITDFKFARR